MALRHRGSGTDGQNIWIVGGIESMQYEYTNCLFVKFGMFSRANLCQDWMDRARFVTGQECVFCPIVSDVFP